MTPYVPRTTAANSIGPREASACFRKNATTAPAAADPHSWATNGAVSPVWPMRRFNRLRSSSISTHPAMPAEAVKPAAPHIGASPNARGSGIAKAYPSIVVSTTRTIANRSGVFVSRSA